MDAYSNEQNCYNFAKDDSIIKQDVTTYEYEPAKPDISEEEYVYMKGLYPLTLRKIQSEVDDCLDHLEYEGSAMFDQYPDRVYLDALTDSVYNKVKYLDAENVPLHSESIEPEFVEATNCRCRCCMPTPLPQPVADYTCTGKPNWLRGTIHLMICNEICCRRRRYRHRKNYYFY